MYEEHDNGAAVEAEAQALEEQDKAEAEIQMAAKAEAEARDAETEAEALANNIMIEASIEIATERAYIAGLFDGEGTAMMLNFKDKKMIKCSISNTNKEVIDWVEKRSPKSCIYNYQPKRKPHYKLVWTIQFSGKKATLFLETIFKYLIIKREQIKNLLAETQY